MKQEKDLNMSTRDYSPFVRRVIEWNRTANKLKSQYTTQDLDNQKARVIEELNEAYDAIEGKNYIELRDALCDIFVTATYLDYMINYKDESFYRRYKKTTSTMYKEEYIKPALDKIKQAIEIDSYDKLAYYVFRLCESINVDIKSDIALVLDNNDSKFLSSQDDAIASAEMYSAKGEEVMIHNSGNLYVILRVSDNKVMKPKNFKSVNLKSVTSLQKSEA